MSLPYMDEEFFSKHGIDRNATFFPDEESKWMEITTAHVSSPYGLLRSPWNYSPSTFVMRFNNPNRISNADVSKHFYRPYMGSTCDDYETFIKTYVVGQTLGTYLKEADAQAHGKLHFTFGGAGGDHCNEVDQTLKAVYNFTDEDLVLLTSAAQTFFKTYIPTMGAGDDRSPLNCSDAPWQNYALISEAAPATAGGPWCQCASSYFESSSKLDELIDKFFGVYADDSDAALIPNLKAMDFDNKAEAMRLLCGRMQFDGDMAGGVAL